METGFEMTLACNRELHEHTDYPDSFRVVLTVTA